MWPRSVADPHTQPPTHHLRRSRPSSKDLACQNDHALQTTHAASEQHKTREEIHEPYAGATEASGGHTAGDSLQGTRRGGFTGRGGR